MDLEIGSCKQSLINIELSDMTLEKTASSNNSKYSATDLLLTSSIDK